MINIQKKRELNGHNGALYSLDFIDEFLISAGFDNIIAKWDLTSLANPQALIKLPSKVISLLYIPDYKLLSIGSIDGSVYLIDIETKKEIAALKYHSDMIFNLTFDSERKELVIGSGDGVISVIDIENKSVRELVDLKSEKIRKILLYNNFYIVGCGDGSIKILNKETFEVVTEIKEHLLGFSIYSLAICNNVLYSSSRDGHLNLYDINSNYGLLERIPAHNYAIYDLVFSPNKNYFATASRDKSIKIWHTNDSKMLIKIDLKSFDAHKASVNKLLWTKKGLFSAGDDRKIMIWDILY